jgi:hypothetical protein
MDGLSFTSAKTFFWGQQDWCAMLASEPQTEPITAHQQHHGRADQFEPSPSVSGPWRNARAQCQQSDHPGEPDLWPAGPIQLFFLTMRSGLTSGA